ncbi:two-component system OmpR family sensor kinase [Oxalobacteraceae bacterium GrIS 2.11]
MDGYQKVLNSLQFKLALALSVTMLIAALSIGAIGYASTMHDVNQLQDDHLRNIAAIVDTNRITINQTEAWNSVELEDPDSLVVIQLTRGTGKAETPEGSAPHLFADNLKDGFQTILAQHEKWRVYVKALPTGEHLVVGQKTEVRDEIAWHAGKETLLRILATIPLLVLLLALMLRWMLSPLTRLASELNSRSAEDTSAIPDDGLPSELLPFISSTNTVLKRIALVLDQQRRFVADAAHELRSPLTALTLQARNLSSQTMPVEAKLKMADFERGLKRANDLVDQLLTMARLQLAGPPKAREVTLQKVVRCVFEELMPYADSKKIVLEFHQSLNVSAVHTAATEMDWITLLRNLVDNAIRYSAPEGRVDVAIDSDESLINIKVRDSGPGIAEDERERVFDSFYRILGTEQSGSGLGLSIVKSLVTTLNGEITLAFSDPESRRGTLVSIKIPQRRP